MHWRECVQVQGNTNWKLVFPDHNVSWNTCKSKFLRFASYYQWYIWNLAIIGRPLHCFTEPFIGLQSVATPLSTSKDYWLQLLFYLFLIFLVCLYWMLMPVTIVLELCYPNITMIPYHPQCGGLVEQFKCTLLTMLATLAKDNPLNWVLLSLLCL